ncbi:MAG: PQQ-like beta-propeller repeat protein, partial [Chloroflexota bacterium]|nr:PQQ-like beta-propeller repeat protein [Chloroflexota bacterium]
TSALTFDGGRIFVTSVTSDGASSHSNLYALSAASGALAWQASFGDTVGQPMVAGGRVFLPVTDPSGPQLRALSERDGGQVWSAQLTGQDALASLALTGNVIAYTHDNTLTALDAATGAPRWSHAAPASIDAPLAVANGDIIFASGQSVFAFDAASGALRWSAVLDARALVQSATASVTYVTTLTTEGQFGQAVALDTHSGDILWQRDLPDLATLALGGADAWLLVPVGAQKLATLVALDAQGADRWRYAGQSPYNIGAVIPSGATLYYVWQGLQSGIAVNPTTITYVTCLRASDGAALWTTPLPALNAFPLSPLLVTG